MKLIVGLGNPEAQYESTRHNAGFMALDLLANNEDFPDWQSSQRFKSLISEASIGKEKVILAKPQTFMNLSGAAVATITSFYKIPAKNIYVIHDDLDLEFGRIKISEASSSGGHKGIESIIDSLGTKDFARIRIGIHAETNLDAAAFVLQNFSKEEKALLPDILKKTVEAVLLAIKSGLEPAMNKYN